MPAQTFTLTNNTDGNISILQIAFDIGVSGVTPLADLSQLGGSATHQTVDFVPPSGSQQSIITPGGTKTITLDYTGQSTQAGSYPATVLVWATGNLTTTLKNVVVVAGAAPGPTPSPTPTPAPSPGTSLDGATITPGVGTLTDAAGDIWTVTSGGVIQKNGVNAGYSANVTLLLWYNNLIYQRNFENLWWSWNGTTWLANVAGDPRPGGVTPPPPNPVSPSVPVSEWLNNNITISSTSGLPLETGEADVLFAGQKTIKPGMFWVSIINYPWCADTNPPSGVINLPPENTKYWAGVQWHGGWYYADTVDRPSWALIPELSPNHVWWRGSTAGMLQFMIRNYNKTSGWTDADYFWTDADRVMQLYGSQGKRYTFHWYVNITGNPINSFNNRSIPSVSVARFRDALQRVANRVTPQGIAYKDVIAFWEGPNEPDSAGSGGTWNWNNQIGTMTVSQLAEQYRIAAQCIKAVQPNALIMGPSYSNVNSHTNEAMRRFLTASAAGRDAGYGTGAGTTGKDWIDIVAQHGYYPQDDADLPGFIVQYRDLVNKINAGGASNKPFVQSEWMSFNGAWPNESVSDAPNAAKYGFEHLMTSIAIGNCQVWTDFRYAWPQQMGNPALSGTASNRARWYSLIDWLTTGTVTRISRMNDGTIRVRKADGSTKTSTNY